MGRGLSAMIAMAPLSVSGLSDTIFQFAEAGPFGRVQYLAAKLYRQARSIAINARKQRNPDALQHFCGFPELLLQHSGERPHQTIAKQDPQKSTHQCLSNEFT